MGSGSQLVSSDLRSILLQIKCPALVLNLAECSAVFAGLEKGGFSVPAVVGVGSVLEGEGWSKKASLEEEGKIVWLVGACVFESRVPQTPHFGMWELVARGLVRSCLGLVRGTDQGTQQTPKTFKRCSFSRAVPDQV